MLPYKNLLAIITTENIYYMAEDNLREKYIYLASISDD